MLIRARWADKTINFNFLKCPTCTKDITKTNHVSEFHQEFHKVSVLKNNIITDAVKHMKADKIPEFMNARNEAEATEVALQQSLYYECNRCNNAFFGGYSNCAMDRIQAEMGNQEKEMVCRDCSLRELGVRDEFFCNKHGLNHIQFKCDQCCDLAAYHSAGNTYLCIACFEDPKRMGKFNCNGNQWKCPLNMEHHHGVGSVPLAKCVMCRSADESFPILTSKSHKT